jgi:hypothetical protein
MEDITKALAYEIKQDIANRYFGFRKRIETESNQYLEKLRSAGKEYAVAIKADVQRMQCLLKKDEIFRTFMNFTGLPDAIGCHTIPQAHSQWKPLFANLKGEGLTRRRRHRNLVYKVYRSLTGNIAAYQDVFIRLEEEHEDICKEIDRFYRRNDLSGILNFLREIDNPDGLSSGALHADRAGLASRNLDQELRIVPPPSVSAGMHSLVQLSPLEEAKPTLNTLIDEAFPLLDQADLKELPI